LAAKSGRAEATALLLPQCADPAKGNASGALPTELAIKNNFPGIAKMITGIKNTKEWHVANRDRLFARLKKEQSPPLSTVHKLQP